jgi:hypothetical protein
MLIRVLMLATVVMTETVPAAAGMPAAAGTTEKRGACNSNDSSNIYSTSSSKDPRNANSCKKINMVDSKSRDNRNIWDAYRSRVTCRGGRKVRLIDLPIPIRSSDCIVR